MMISVKRMCGILALLIPAVAPAQSGKFDLPAYPELGNFSTFEEAEIALKSSDATNRSNLILHKTTILSGLVSEYIIYEYKDPPVEPDHYLGPYYGAMKYCSGPTEESGKKYCVSASDAMQAYQRRLDEAPACPGTKYEVVGTSGSFDEPRNFKFIAPAEYNGEAARAIIQVCGAYGSEPDAPFQFFIDFKVPPNGCGFPEGVRNARLQVRSVPMCPIGYSLHRSSYPRMSYLGAVQCGSYLDIELDAPAICHAAREYSSNYRIRRSTADLYESCNVNDNPCVASRGTKVRSEADFKQFGMMFSRQYSSVPVGHGSAGLGPGWQWNFSKKMVDTSDGLAIFDSNGLLRKFVYDVNTHAYLSLDNEGGYIVNGVDKVLHEPDGEQWKFDGFGKLKTWIPGDGETAVNFDYRLKNNQVKSISSGDHSIYFSYEHDLLESVEVSPGAFYRYFYDDLDRLVRVEYPTGRIRPIDTPKKDWQKVPIFII